MGRQGRLLQPQLKTRFRVEPIHLQQSLFSSNCGSAGPSEFPDTQNRGHCRHFARTHFVAFSLFKDPLATGRITFEAASEVGGKTSGATVNGIALEMSFKSVLTQKREKLTTRQMAYRVRSCEQVKIWFGYHLPWIFTDEHLLVLNPVKRKIRVVRGVEVDEKFFDVRGYPQKVMV